MGPIIRAATGVAGALALASAAFAGEFRVTVAGYDNISVGVTGGLFTNANGYQGFEYGNGWVAQNGTLALHPETYELGTWHAIHTGEYTDGSPVSSDASTGLIFGSTIDDPGTPFGVLGPGGTGPLGLSALPQFFPGGVPSGPTAFPELGRSGHAVFLGRYTITGGTISGVFGVGVPTPEDQFSVFYFDVDSTALAPVFSDDGIDLGLYLRPRPGIENSFDIYLTDVPTPGAAAPLGVAVLAVTRRRRVAR